MDEPEGPTTGDPRLDVVVRARFTDAIETARQVIVDYIPDVDPAVADKTAAVIIANVWRPLALVVIQGINLRSGEFVDADPQI